MPDTRPRVLFDDGICNGCLFMDQSKLIDGQVNYKDRSDELDELVEIIKKESKDLNHPYNCIVPWSGGKDSSSVALRLKNDHKLKPLLVTFNPLIPTEVGEHNKRALLNKGFYIESNFIRVFII